MSQERTSQGDLSVALISALSSPCASLEQFLRDGFPPWCPGALCSHQPVLHRHLDHGLFRHLLTYPTSSNSTSTTSKTNLADSSSTTSELGILVIGGSPYSRSVELWAPASHKEGGKVVELIGDYACVCCNIGGR